jgi:hypothetical protein
MRRDDAAAGTAPIPAIVLQRLTSARSFMHQSENLQVLLARDTWASRVLNRRGKGLTKFHNLCK